MKPVSAHQPHDVIIDSHCYRTRHARERLYLRELATHYQGIELLEMLPVTCGDCGRDFRPRHRRQLQRLDEGKAVFCSRDCARRATIRAYNHRSH